MGVGVWGREREGEGRETHGVWDASDVAMHDGTKMTGAEEDVHAVRREACVDPRERMEPGSTIHGWEEEETRGQGGLTQERGMPTMPCREPMQGKEGDGGGGRDGTNGGGEEEEEEDETDQEEECPLCMEPLDITDKHIQFCQCGYRICLWCWHQIMENADRESIPGRCPACRAIYQQKDIEESLKNSRLRPEKLMEKAKKQKASQRYEKKGQQKDRKHLQNVRVVQKNLVYVIGLSMKDCREEVLRRNDMFGRFGKVAKVSVNRNGVYSSANNMTGPTGSAYITFLRNEDAMRCIQYCDGATVDGKVIRCCYGTTKYCNAFLKHQQCTNPECLYLHEIESGNDSFTREEMLARYDAKPPTSTTGSMPTAASTSHAVANVAPVAGSRIMPPVAAATQPIQVPSTSTQQVMQQPLYGGQGPSAGMIGDSPQRCGMAAQTAPPGMILPQQANESLLFAGEGQRHALDPPSKMYATGNVQSTLQQMMGGGTSVPDVVQSSALQSDQATWLGRAGASLQNPPTAPSKRTMTSLGTPGQVVPREQPALGLGATHAGSMDQSVHSLEPMRAGLYGRTSQAMGMGGGYPSASTSVYRGDGGQGLQFQSSAMGAYFSHTEMGQTRGLAGQMVGPGVEQGLFEGVSPGYSAVGRTGMGEGFVGQNQMHPAERVSNGQQLARTSIPHPPPGFETVRDEMGMIQDMLVRPIPAKESRRSTSRFSFAEQGQVEDPAPAEVPLSMDGDSFFRSFLPDANIKIVTQSTAPGAEVAEGSKRPPPPGFGGKPEVFEQTGAGMPLYGANEWNSDGTHGKDVDVLGRAVRNVTL